MIIIISWTILPRIFKFISFHLIVFWELWLFNYLFSFTLDFPIPNLMDWHQTNGFPSISVSRTYVKYFSSIQWGNPKLLAFQCGFRMWSLMGVEVQGTILNYRLPNQYLGVFWPTLHPMHVYKPHISTPWASFAPFSFGEWERNFGVRAQISFFNKRGSNINLGKFSSTNQNFQVRNTFMFQNLTFHFQFNSKHVSPNLKKKFFIELLMTSTNWF